MVVDKIFLYVRAKSGDIAIFIVQDLKLVTVLRTAGDNDGTPDKETTSYDDISMLLGQS